MSDANTKQQPAPNATKKSDAMNFLSSLGLNTFKATDENKTPVKALLYAASGKGKTTSIKGFGERKSEDGKGNVKIAGLPRESTLILCTEPKGVLPLQGEGFTVMTINSWTDFEMVVDSLLSSKEWQETYKTIVLDSISFLSLMLEDFVTSTLRTQAETIRAKRTAAYADALELQEYNVYRNRFSQTLRSFTSLPAHIIVLALAEDNPMNEVRFKPKVSGRLRDDLPAFFDIVLFMDDAVFEADGKQVVLRGWYTSRPDTQAKNGTGKKLKEFLPPDWGLFIKGDNNQ